MTQELPAMAGSRRARESFSDSLPRVPARCRLTTRLFEQVGAGVADKFLCFLAAADAHGMSWPVAQATFIGHVTPPVEQAYRR